MGGFGDALIARFGDQAREGVPLAPLTTFRVGGPAEWYLAARSSDDVRDALRLAREWGVPVTMLGGGSNVLISDRGVRGLVVHPKGGTVSLVSDLPQMEREGFSRAVPEREGFSRAVPEREGFSRAVPEREGFSRAVLEREGFSRAVLEREGFSLRQGSGAQVSRADPDHGDEVRADAAVTINGLVRWTIARGLAGLEAWAGTPGTVGGGIHGNAHFQGRLLSEHVTRVCLLTRAGEEAVVEAAEMGFGYDRSRLQGSGEVLLWAAFRVGRGEPDDLRATARASLAYRKRTQPLHMASAGCIFQNPSDDDPLPEGMPRSAGALIDRAGLKGMSAGAARVSDVHANFIVNVGGASAEEIRSLVERCRSTVARTFGVLLRDEIVYLGGFDTDGPERPPAGEA